MMKVLLLLLFGFVQSGQSQIVHRVFVNTPNNTSIIYEYANIAFPENQPIKEGAIECFESQLKATGLFTDVKVILKKAQKKREVDIFVEPIWSVHKDTLFIDEIIFKDFQGVDENKLQESLRQKGVAAGARFLIQDFLSIREKTQDALTEITEFNPKPNNDAKKQMSNIVTKVTLISPGKVRIMLIAGLNELCD